MTDEQAQAIVERLDRIIRLLEDAKPKQFSIDWSQMHVDADRMDIALKPLELTPPPPKQNPGT